MRNFAIVQNLLSTLVITLCIAIWGLAAVPGAALVMHVFELTAGEDLWIRALWLGLSGGGAYFLWGISCLVIVSTFGIILRPNLPEARVPLKSALTVRWAFLSLLHRMATPFLNQAVPSWVANTYFRAMGCTIGSGAQITSSRINDCFMVTLGDDVVIGGDATINGHVVEKGELVLAQVKIGTGAIIGARCTIMPGCIIGDGAVIAGHAILSKWTEVPPGEIWGGVPAKCIRLADGSKPE
jgi:acetyltransferase-like isoleucine patch superfamily enzyme